MACQVVLVTRSLVNPLASGLRTRLAIALHVMIADLCPGFCVRRVQVSTGDSYRVLIDGTGPAILLLHGWPQSLAAWHRIAPSLAEAGLTVVVADLPGYGERAAGTRARPRPSNHRGERSTSPHLQWSVTIVAHGSDSASRWTTPTASPRWPR